MTVVSLMCWFYLGGQLQWREYPMSARDAAGIAKAVGIKEWNAAGARKACDALTREARAGL